MSAIRQIIEQGLYKEALSVLIWVLSFKTPDQKREHLNLMRQELLTSEFVVPPASDGNVLFLRSLGREDYASMFGVIYNACSCSTKTYLESFKKKKVKYNQKAVAYFEENIDLEDWLEVRDPLDRQCAFMLLVTYCYLLEEYSQVKFRAVVVFSDMQPIENLFVQYFRSKGIPTVSTQHGLYVDYGEYKTINCINYMNHASDYFLAWGDNTAELISAYHPEAKIVMCGKPVIFQGKSSPQKSGSKAIMVVLDQSIFNEKNFAMLGIAYEYAKEDGYEVRVRFHPNISNKPAFFKDFPDIVESSNFLDADIVVGHTTSLLFEALALSKRVVQYKTDIPSIDLPSGLQFKDLSSIKKAIGLPIEADPAKSYFCALNNVSKQRYADFFTFLLEGGNSHRVEFYKGVKGKKRPHIWYTSMQRDFYENSLSAACQELTAGSASPSSALPVLQHDQLNALVVPCLTSDIPNIEFIFGMWSAAPFAPSLTGRKVKLLLVFNRLDTETRRKVIEMWNAHPKLLRYFDELLVESADLVGDRDLYDKNRSREVKGEFGNIAGPNFLFQSAMNYAARFGGYVFQMEVDCFPLTQGWIEALDRVISRAGGAWIIGAMYNGDFQINNSIRMHYNGNALYKVGDPRFIDFLNSIWIPRLMDLSKEMPNIAYDCWWSLEIERAKTNDLSSHSSWNLVRRYSSFFANEPYIINLLKTDPIEERFMECFCFYESVGKPPIFLHYAYSKTLADRVLSGEADSIIDLLLPAANRKSDFRFLNARNAPGNECDLIKLADRTRLSSRGGDVLAELSSSMLSISSPSSSRCQLFLTSCVSELLLRPVQFRERIGPGGDLEKPLTFALKYNNDTRIVEQLERILGFHLRIKPPALPAAFEKQN